MADPTIVPDVPASSSQPPGQLPEIREPSRFGQLLVRTSRPFHRNRQRGSQSPKAFQRPVFLCRAGEGMDHDARTRLHFPHGDSRRKTHWRAHLRSEEIDRMNLRIHRQGRMKRERQSSHSASKVFVATAVPGDDPVELGQPRHRPFLRLNRHHVQAGRSDALHAVRKPDEGLHGTRNPNLGVIGPQMLQSRQPDDAIANRPRPDQQRLQRRSTAMRTSTVFGGKHMVSEQAW